MDEDMWAHGSTKVNIEKVKGFGNRIIPVAHGELASGLIGEGRMAEPEDVVAFLTEFFTIGKPLAGLKAMVTAGPTYELIDPVRFIGNFSTGKMGIAIAEALAERGASVTLILGPSSLRPQQANIRTINVASAEQMYDAAMANAGDSQIAVLSAAVADYRPAEQSETKIKKKESGLTIELIKNKDILASIGKIKHPGQTLVGFALETNNELDNAINKLREKNADIMVLNSLRDEGAGFGHDTNKVTLLMKDGGRTELPLQSKKAAAAAIVQHIIDTRC
jgi:phosphopantothenoylcysteine decarboxylase/phosphopantothenate--cysteine ligase